MTVVTFSTSNNVHNITAQGHAGYSNDNDVVCAGISTIMCGLEGYIRTFCSDDMYTIIVNSGYVNITVTATDCTDKGIEFAKIALMQLELSFPNNINVKI